MDGVVEVQVDGQAKTPIKAKTRKVRPMGLVKGDESRDLILRATLPLSLT